MSVSVPKLRTLFLKLIAQLAKILDDAVMDDSEPFGGVGMRVVLGRLAVGCPAGMTDTGQSGQRLSCEALLQIPELAFGAPAFEMAVFDRRNARRIVAAIFQPLQRVDELTRNRLTPENSDNSAHAVPIPPPI